MSAPFKLGHRATVRSDTLEYCTKTLKVSTAVIAADQLTKIVVIQNRWPHRLNPGGFFSLMSNFGNYTALAVVILLVLLFLWFIFAHQRNKNNTLKIGGGLLLGGAVSNTLDRVFRGGVLDFLQIGPWLNFNLADAAIVLGVVFTILIIFTPPQKLSAVDKGTRKN